MAPSRLVPLNIFLKEAADAKHRLFVDGKLNTSAYESIAYALRGYGASIKYIQMNVDREVEKLLELHEQQANPVTDEGGEGVTEMHSDDRIKKLTADQAAKTKIYFNV